MPFNSETARRWGRVGGIATKRRMLKDDPEYYVNIGLKGGNKIKAERGREFYSKIGSISPYKKDLLAKQKAEKEADD